MQHRSNEQLQADIAQLQSALRVPNIPADEAQMHTKLIARLQAELKRRAESGPAPSEKPITRQINQQTPGGRIAHNTPPASVRNTSTETLQFRKIHAGGMAPTTDPITSTIEVDAFTDPHNPRISISWADGYRLTVDETAATGRFKTTLRDCVALRCVAEGRLAKMWRWDTPWRCTGFYQALTEFWGKEPSMKELGISHPTDKQREVFALIQEKSNPLTTS